MTDLIDRSDRPPLSPAEHHMAATTALAKALEYGPNDAPRIAFLLESIAHGTLAQYVPPVKYVIGLDPEPAIPSTEPAKAPQRRPRTKKAPEGSDA